MSRLTFHEQRNIKINYSYQKTIAKLINDEYRQENWIRDSGMQRNNNKIK